MRITFFILLLSSTACHSSSNTDRERHTAAYEAGRAAREIAKESAKAAKAAGHELKNGARDAHEGWKDQSRADRAKSKP